ncbi:MAG: hypothetical protein Fur0023_00880 [Bacteroidia bacterium]
MPAVFTKKDWKTDGRNIWWENLSNLYSENIFNQQQMKKLPIHIKFDDQERNVANFEVEKLN